MFRLSRKFKVCRYFNTDLWGKLRIKQSLSRVFVQFIRQYQVRRTRISLFARSKVIRRRFQRKSFYGKLLNLRKKVFAFYGGLRLSSPNWSGSQEQMLKVLISNISSFESRLSTLLYRANFAQTVFESLILILSGIVSVNRRVVRGVSCCLNGGDIFELREYVKETRFYLVLNSLKRRKVVLFKPRYLEVSYSLLAGTLLYLPRYREVQLPFKLSRSRFGF